MKDSSLIEVDWQVAQRDENPLSAETVTRSFELSKSLHVLITNQVGGIRCDTWLILERHKDTALDARRVIMSYIGNASSQTRALNNLRKYAWAVYRRDIFFVDVPF